MARVAFFVGIREYGSGFESLPASPRDVEAFSAVLQNRDFGGFQDVIALKDEPQAPAVSRFTVEETLERWCRSHDPQDLAVLYISGYLVWDEHDEIFLATNETRYENGSLIRSSAVAGTFIRQCLQRSAAKTQLVILDCCFQPSDPCAASQCWRSPDVRRYFGGDRCLVLVSDDDVQYSVEQKQERFSIYTQFLVEGIITGLADGDRDQSVSVQELHTFLQEKLRIATPAIAPALFSPSDDLAEIPLSKVNISDAQRRYCNETARIIQRHGTDGSAISSQSLEVLQHQLGISNDCAQILKQTILNPYAIRRTSLEKYREKASQLIQCALLPHADIYTQLNITRYQLGLTPDLVEPINQELRYLHQLRNLEQYRTALTQALRHEQPLSEKTQQDLADLRRSLGIAEQDETLISQEVDAYWKTHQQKLEQYRVKFQQAIQNGVAQNSLIREELDNFRQSLGLSNQDIEPLEQQVQQAMMGSSDRPTPPNSHAGFMADDAGDRLRRLQTFKQRAMEATSRHLPLTSDDEASLAMLQIELGLSDDDVQPVKEDVIKTAKAQADVYQQKVTIYEETYRDAARKGFPLSEDAQSLIDSLEKTLQIAPQDVHVIRDEIYAQWQTQQDAETLAPSPNDTSLPIHGAMSSSALPQTELEHQTELEPSSIPLTETLVTPGRHHISGNISASYLDWKDDDANLRSERGIDYRHLRECAREHRWGEADAETFSILLGLAHQGRRRAEWLDHQAIADLPCTDVQTIDHLWRLHSGDKFGFSVQCRIYLGMTAANQSARDDAITFGGHVGWLLWEKEFLGFKYYDQLSFDHQSALEGHLPAKWFWKIPWWESVRCGGLGTGRGGCGDDGGILLAFMKKLVNCNMNEHD